MKKGLKIAVLMAAVAMMVAGCNHNRSQIEGFERTESGLHYKFLKSNPDSLQVQLGDVLICKINLKLDTVTLSDKKEPQRLPVRESLFPGDLSEGLLMMHKGDKAMFAIEADSTAKFFDNMMPTNYRKGLNQKLYYEIELIDIVTKAEVDAEEANQSYPLVVEPERISKYIADNNITAQPDSNGLYVIVDKAGKGKAIEMGKRVKFDLSVYLLDGSLYATTLEKVAREHNAYDEEAEYKPFNLVMGEKKLIQGLSLGLIGQKQGSELTLIIPSQLAYGARGFHDEIGPFEPLVIKVNILNVN